MLQILQHPFPYLLRHNAVTPSGWAHCPRRITWDRPIICRRKPEARRPRSPIWPMHNGQNRVYTATTLFSSAERVVIQRTQSQSREMLVLYACSWWFSDMQLLDHFIWRSQQLTIRDSMQYIDWKRWSRWKSRCYFIILDSACHYFE